MTTLLGAPTDGDLATTIGAFQQRFAASSTGSAENEQRDRIMAVTMRIAAAEGVKGATLRRIAAETGMRTASLYDYFPGGKGELVMTALADGLTSFYRGAATVLRPDESARETLRRLVFFHVQWTLTNTVIAPAILILERAHALVPATMDDPGESIRDLHQCYRQLLLVLLHDLGVAGKDSGAAAELLVVVCDNADRWAGDGQPWGVDADRGVDVAAAQEFAWLSLRRLLGLPL